MRNDLFEFILAVIIAVSIIGIVLLLQGCCIIPQATISVYRIVYGEEEYSARLAEARGLPESTDSNDVQSQTNDTTQEDSKQ